MDTQNYTTEHRKGQHLLAEERHEIEVRRKDGWSIYRIAKHLGRPYNTIKNEVARGTVYLYNGKIARYKAKVGEEKYRDTRKTVATAAVSTDDWKYLALSSMSKSSSPRGGLWMCVSERRWKPRDFVGIRSSVQKRCTTMWTTV